MENPYEPKIASLDRRTHHLIVTEALMRFHLGKIPDLETILPFTNSCDLIEQKMKTNELPAYTITWNPTMAKHKFVWVMRTEHPKWSTTIGINQPTIGMHEDIRAAVASEDLKAEVNNSIPKTEEIKTNMRIF